MDNGVWESLEIRFAWAEKNARSNRATPTANLTGCKVLTVINVMRKSRYTKEMLLSALEGAESIKDVMSNLGLNVNSRNYRVCH